MKLKNIKPYYCPILFGVVSACFFVIVTVSHITISKLKKMSSIHIRIFNRIVPLPNISPNFFVLDSIATNEVRFMGNDQSVVIGKKIKEKSDFFAWVQKNNVSQSQNCSVNIIKIESANIKSTVIYDDSDFIWFANVKDELVNAWIRSLCKQ